MDKYLISSPVFSSKEAEKTKKDKKPKTKTLEEAEQIANRIERSLPHVADYIYSLIRTIEFYESIIVSCAKKNADKENNVQEIIEKSIKKISKKSKKKAIKYLKKYINSLEGDGK